MIKNYNLTCKRCNKKFTYSIEGDIYPGGKDKEYIFCPYCEHINGTEMTSGHIKSYKLDENGNTIK